MGQYGGGVIDESWCLAVSVNKNIYELCLIGCWMWEGPIYELCLIYPFHANKCIFGDWANWLEDFY